MAERMPVVTIKCKTCGWTAKRRPGDNNFGHVHDFGWCYICPECNSDCEVVNKELPEDVRVNDPITLSKIEEEENRLKSVSPWKVWTEEELRGMVPGDLRPYVDKQDMDKLSDKPLWERGEKVSSIFSSFTTLLRKYEDELEIHNQVDFNIARHIANARWELWGAILLMKEKWGL